MITRLYSAALRGVEAVEVEVEVSSRGEGEPRIYVVGLPDTAVRESVQRVTSAIGSNAMPSAGPVVTINLAPADLKKEGPSFDLPIALAMAAAAGTETIHGADDSVFVGELALNGELRPVKGILSIATEAKRRGRRRLYVPEQNAAEAAIVDGIEVYAVRTVRDVWLALIGEFPMTPVSCDRAAIFADAQADVPDFEDVKGQHNVKRALEVAAAGGHNLLMIGPPGTGKSMLAKRLPGILTPMTENEAIETTKIHSIAGTLDRKRALMTQRPFRAPHHTVSDAGLLGGGTNPGPGEVSLAHNGVLFLDELPEFRRQTLEVMRQPLEDANVTISRAAGTLTFPSKMMLVAAMNPCPCGFATDPKRDCRCSPRQIESYRQRISGPLLDRIDIHVEVPRIEYRELSSRTKGEPSHHIRDRVKQARERQLARFSDAGDTFTNSAMGSRQMREFCQVDVESGRLLEHAMEQLHFSARAHDRILKVARTLADLAGEETIAAPHVLEAIQFRTLDRGTI